MSALDQTPMQSNGRYAPPTPADASTTSGLGPPGLDVFSKRLQEGLRDRRRHEPTWDLCKAFLSGRQWTGIHPRTGRVIRDNTLGENREHHTVNVTTQYHQTVLGKLFVEDLRPSLLFARDDTEALDVVEHSRNVARYIWDVEAQADKRVYTMLHKMLAYGTGAIRCIFDRTEGPPLGEMPIGPDGNPITDPQEAYQYVTQAAQQGQQVPFEMVNEGRIRLESLGPRNIVVPAGIEDSDDFPWLIIQTTVPVEWIPAMYPMASGPVKADDISSTDSLDSREMPTDDFSSPYGASGKIRDHVIVSTCYEMPTPQTPNGRVYVWSEKNKMLLDDRPSLPYRLRGKPHHGIVFFHFHKVPERFWGRGVVEDLIGPQRQLNRARSQMIELKDRNLGRVYARKGTITVNNQPKGKIMELIEIPLHSDFPQETAGGGIGPWIQNEYEINLGDMNRVAGMSDVSISGTPPPGLAAYASLALLAQQDERRVGPVLKDLRIGLADALLLMLELARAYWPNGKQMAVSGPDESMQVMNYNRAMLPPEFYISVTSASPVPTDPAAETQKIFDIWNGMIAAGQPLPGDWLYDSLQQGKALPIPKAEQQVQKEKADQENVMIWEGMMVVPSYYDDDFVHIQEHRQAQVEWGADPDHQMFTQAIEQHIQMHLQNAQMKKPMMGQTGSVPSQQGSHGVEAQNGPHPNMQGAAQTASGTAPIVSQGQFGGNG